MILNQFEIVTALTIILSGAILTVYLYLLKMNGWIGKSFDETTANSNSDKPLQIEGEIKDSRSTKRNEVEGSEPEFSVNRLSDGIHTGVAVVPSSNTEMKTIGSAPKIAEKVFTDNNYKKQNEIDTNANPVTESKEKDSFEKINHKFSIKPETVNTKKERPEGCNNFLGYLKTLSKSSPFPDECLACSNLIDCTREVITRLKDKENSKTMNNESFTKQESVDIKKEKPQGCNNFLGYLKVSPKGTPLPEECFVCIKLVDCFNKTKQ